jgi:hypothetical protein
LVAPSQSGRLNLFVREAAQRAIVIKAMQILHLAWPDAVKDSRITRASDEDAITNVLRWKMVDAKNRLDPVPEMQFLREPQSDRPELDTPLGLIDIMVSYTWDESTYLTMECKRVSSTENSLALKYVRNGINRFACGKYSPSHAFGAMVGYVICGNSIGCIDRVQKALNKEPESETGYDVSFGWQSDDRSIEGCKLFKSRHRQQAHDNMIELIHSFVELN